MSTTINTERLGTLVDRGESVLRSATAARNDLAEKEGDLVQIGRPIAVLVSQTVSGVLKHSPTQRELHDYMASADDGTLEKLGAKRTQIASFRSALARVQRLRESSAALARKAGFWKPYLESLRTLSKKHGIQS
ncbi:hypothetical protein SRS16CHR_01801 [Variovorax sp. SRS16]|uniref:hypothetical protein n=1 Tax=Variovorax sp. SRS16 TaxID=282217 RepID=UPI001318D163|nr:hypothetical protein [Variovorax sp. SRS16]VTU16538.1 hypothetical protein SRS16CHR_01801 [Variovorax sp. SRS16]